MSYTRKRQNRPYMGSTYQDPSETDRFIHICDCSLFIFRGETCVKISDTEYINTVKLMRIPVLKDFRCKVLK